MKTGCYVRKLEATGYLLPDAVEMTYPELQAESGLVVMGLELGTNEK